MAVRTGTASQVDGSAGDGSISVTVPAAATGVVVFWTFYDPGSGGVNSLSLGGAGMTIQEQLQHSAGDEPACGIATLLAPATGSQTFAWTYDGGGARSEGGWFALTYVNDLNSVTPFRDTALDQEDSSVAVSVTVTTQTTDLLLAFCQNFSGASACAFDVAATTYIDNAIVNSERYDVGEITTVGSPNTTFGMTNEEYSTLGGISLPAGDSTAGVARFSALEFPKHKLRTVT